MPRNKTVKRTAKPRTMNNALANMQKMERDFMGIPVKFAALLNKEISALKQKENKLKIAINKFNAQIKKSESRLKAATKASSSKKQLNSIKKTHNEITQAQTMLSRQLKDNAQSLETTVKKHAKLIALDKHLTQFERDWAKNAKKIKATKSNKAKPKTKKTKSTSTMRPVIEQPVVEHFETTLSDVRLNESAELTS